MGYDSRMGRASTLLFSLTLLAAPWLGAPPAHAEGIKALWANDGGDKVTRDETRASHGLDVTNPCWDGKTVRLFGAKNEIIAFNMVLEAGNTPVAGVKARFTPLTGQWDSRDIELFLVRYLQIRGLSRLSYETYDERHVPARFRRSHTANGIGRGTWEDRPDHDKFYPEIAVPLEMAAKDGFSIPPRRSQSLWVDIYIPKDTPAGLHTAQIEIIEGSEVTRIVPLSLDVRPFTLPDAASTRTMVFLGYDDLARRYLGKDADGLSGGDDAALQRIRDRHFQMAHRHRISLIDADPGVSAVPTGRPRPAWIPRLDGSLFTPAHGYRGPGEGVGNGIYSIGTYGTWAWKSGGEKAMQINTDMWEHWFTANHPTTERFLYLIDEATEHGKTEEWARWVRSNRGPGRKLYTFATLPLPDAVAKAPSLTMIGSWFTSGPKGLWEKSFVKSKAEDKRFVAYNGKRPANGSFATEDDGVALRQLPWAQRKMGVHRWFFWESTYYRDYQNGRGNTDVWTNAQTFGCPPTQDVVVGEAGCNHSNGDGVLFYPGTDKVFPKESYDVAGPVASLRLKHWRRGIQDMDYYDLAVRKNPAAAAKILKAMVPQALWEYDIDDPKDPTWVRTDISWPTDPAAWERARLALAQIIEGGHPDIKWTESLSIKPKKAGLGWTDKILLKYDHVRRKVGRP